MLIGHENVVDVVWVRGAAGQLVAQYLEDVFESTSIVDVDVCFESFAICEERQLKIPILVRCLETFRGYKARRWSV